MVLIQAAAAASRQIRVLTWAEQYKKSELNAHETRDSISLISYAGCLGLSPVHFSET